MKLKDLPIGSRIQFGKYQVEEEISQPITWIILDKNHQDYPENSCTLLTEKIIDLRAFDAKEPNNPNSNRKSGGNNFYISSNINQWLNSDKNKGKWYQPQHEYDAPPIKENLYDEGDYYNHSGFLYYFTKGEKYLLLNTNIKVLGNNIIEKDSIYNLITKVFLLSNTEVGIGDNLEGYKFTYFKDMNSRLAFLTQQCLENTKIIQRDVSIYGTDAWRLRTPTNTTDQTAKIGAGGKFDYYLAVYSNQGIRPACNVSLDCNIKEIEEGLYKIIPPSLKYINFKRS